MSIQGLDGHSQILGCFTGVEVGTVNYSPTRIRPARLVAIFITIRHTLDRRSLAGPYTTDLAGQWLPTNGLFGAVKMLVYLLEADPLGQIRFPEYIPPFFLVPVSVKVGPYLSAWAIAKDKPLALLGDAGTDVGYHLASVRGKLLKTQGGSP